MNPGPPPPTPPTPNEQKQKQEFYVNAGQRTIREIENICSMVIMPDNLKDRLTDEIKIFIYNVEKITKINQ